MRVDGWCYAPLGIHVRPGHDCIAAIAQLGERQTEDLKVPGSIPGLGIIFWHYAFKQKNAIALLAGSRASSHTTPLHLICCDALSL